MFRNIVSMILFSFSFVPSSVQFLEKLNKVKLDQAQRRAEIDISFKVFYIGFS